MGDAAAAFSQKPRNKAEWEAALPKAKEAIGKCPVCQKLHTYKRKFDFGTIEWPSALLKTCPTFASMTPVDRGKKLKKCRGCPKCTSWKHCQDQCWFRKKSACDVKTGGKSCGRLHTQLLHGSGSKYCQAAGIVSVTTY